MHSCVPFCQVLQELIFQPLMDDTEHSHVAKILGHNIHLKSDILVTPVGIQVWFSFTLALSCLPCIQAIEKLVEHQAESGSFLISIIPC